MNDKELDPNLQAPQEANTTKHINFLEAEENTASNTADTGDDDGYDSPTKKAWEELRRDQNPRQSGE